MPPRNDHRDQFLPLNVSLAVLTTVQRTDLRAVLLGLSEVTAAMGFSGVASPRVQALCHKAGSLVVIHVSLHVSQ